MRLHADGEDSGDDDDGGEGEVDGKDQFRATLTNAGQSWENVWGTIAKSHYCHSSNVLRQPGRHQIQHQKL